MAEQAAEPSALEASRGLGQRSFWLTARALAAVALPGAYAWGATVAWPAFSSGAASPVARTTAGAALGALVVGLALARRGTHWGRALGVLGFVGLSAATWGALGEDLRAPRLDPVRAALGALAWGLFALGWGGFPPRRQLPEEDPQAVVGGRLSPRGHLPRSVGVACVGLLVGALALPLLAWRVERPGVALLAQAAALAGSVGLLSVGTRVLLLRPNLEHPPLPRLGPALVVLWLALGALAWLL